MRHRAEPEEHRQHGAAQTVWTLPCSADAAGQLVWSLECLAVDWIRIGLFKQVGMQGCAKQPQPLLENFPFPQSELSSSSVLRVGEHNSYSPCAL